MVARRTALSLLRRTFAATTLLVWLAALVFCSVDCCVRNSDCQPAHHDKQAAVSHHDQAPDPENHSHHDDSACDSLKTLVPTAHNNLVPKPDFGFCVLSFVSPPQVVAIPESEAAISRQPPDREFMFTPEVSLGPAFRSHAPPVLL